MKAQKFLRISSTVALCLLLAVPGQIGPAVGQMTASNSVQTEAAVTAVGSRTAEELSACLQLRPNLAVAMLIDETGSLRLTDPKNERAAVLAGFLGRLEDLASAESEGRTRQVLVSVAYFGTGVDELLGWQPIETRLSDEGAGAGVTRSIADTILAITPERNRERTTQFSDALAWATQRQKELGQFIDPASVCTMTVWFSDGELDPDNQPGAPYERDAVIAETAALCMPRGVLDEHRRTGAALVGILLVERMTDSSSMTTLPRMHAMVEGVDRSGRSCGSENSRGLYLEGGLDLLSLRFERAVTPGQGGVLQGTYVGDPVTFMVDPGVARVRIVMSARDGFRLTTAAGATVVADVPGGQPSTSGLRRGVAPDIRWASGAVSIDLVVAEDFGEWTVERKNRTSEVDVYYFADVRLEIDLDEVRLTSGESGTFEGRVTNSAGAAADLQQYAAAVLSGTVDGAPANVDLRPDGSFVATFPVETDQARIGAALRLDLTTAGGTLLQPVKRDVLLPVTLPGWFPQVNIAREFDASLAPGSERAALGIIALGSDLGSTRVCVELGAPGDGAADLMRLVTLGWAGSDLSRCIELARGERVESAIIATLRESEVRAVRVAFPITVILESAAVDGRASVTVDYPESRSVEVLAAPPNRALVALLLLLGLLIPLLVLHLLNRSAARFRTRNLQYVRMPVELARSEGAWSIRHVGRPAAALFEPDDFDYLPTEGINDAREWTARLSLKDAPGSIAGETWRSRTPIWPLGTVRADVTAPTGHRIISNEAPTVQLDGTSAGIGLNPQRCAYLMVADDALRSVPEEGAAEIPATLVTLLGHAGSDMGTVVSDHGSQLERGLTGGDEVQRLIVSARDAHRPEATDQTGAPAILGEDRSAWDDGSSASATPTTPAGDSWDSPHGSPSRENQPKSGWD